MNEERAREGIKHVTQALTASKTGALLDELAWPREVEESFFANGATELPTPTYAIDHDGLSHAIRVAREELARIEGEGPIAELFRKTLETQIDKFRLLDAVGTRDFGHISYEIYGGAKSEFLGKTKLALAEHLLDRVREHGWDRARRESSSEIGADELAERFESRIAGKKGLELKVVVDPALTSKAIAGTTRVRIRDGATFQSWEAEGLYRHEIETHAYSAQNGLLQRDVPFLRTGGPRSTETQEGLAVFAELYHRALATPRLRRLALRVKMVAMAEDGADFLDVYRFLIGTEGLAPKDAFLDASRIFRGGIVSGGSVFTKDTVYISGLMRVYAFLSVFVRGGFRDECELVMAGRIDLDDVLALVELSRMGLVSRPRFLPRWLREWDTLLPTFAFTSFLDGLDLTPVEHAYEDLVAHAEAARPRG